MSFNIKVGGAWQVLESGWVKVAGVWEEIDTAWAKVSGAWQKVYTRFSATADKASVSGNGVGPSPCGDPGNTDVVTITAVGGSPPYSYAWARVGAAADSGPYQVNTPVPGNVTAFSDVDSSVCEADVNSTEVWRCTVTDDDLDTVTVDVNVTLLWADSS